MGPEYVWGSGMWIFPLVSPGVFSFLEVLGGSSMAVIASVSHPGGQPKVRPARRWRWM